MALYAFDGTWNTAKDNEDPTLHKHQRVPVLSDVSQAFANRRSRSRWRRHPLGRPGQGPRRSIWARRVAAHQRSLRSPVQSLGCGGHRHRCGWLQSRCRHDVGFLPLHSRARHQAARQRSGRRAESPHSLPWGVGRGCRIRPRQPRQYSVEHRPPFVAAKSASVLLSRHGARRASAVLPAHASFWARGKCGSVGSTRT